MQAIVYSLFLGALSLEYLARIEQVIPREATLLIELLSLVVVLLVIGRFSMHKRLDLEPTYLLIFAFFGLFVVTGAVINQLDPGTAIGGIRVYFKFVPFFLLPLVYRFTDEQFRRQLVFVFVLLCAQLPITLFQRFFMHAYTHTGDVVRGTLPTGSLLSILLISAVSVVIGFYLKKRLTFAQMTTMVLVLLIPTTINETKGSLVLLPVAMLVPFIFLAGVTHKFAKVVGGGIFAVVFMVGFVAMYNATQQSFGGNISNLGEMITNPQRLMHYLAPQTGGFETIDDRYGRIDTVLAPIKELSEDPVKLIVGLGIGGVTQTPISFLSDQENVEYRELGMVGVAMSYLLWELGFLGVGLMLIVLLLFLRDAIVVSRLSDKPIGSFALGFTGVLGVFFVSLFYKNVVTTDAIMCLFALFAGHIVSARYKLVRENVSRPALFVERPVMLGVR